MAFPQFEVYFPDIVNVVINEAYEFLHYSSILQKEKETIGFSFLVKYYKAIYIQTVEFILELLAIGGRLPDFELISNSLRSNNTKIRANAIETIEQGVSRDIFKILLPLVDSRNIEEKIQFFKSNFSIKEINAQEIVQTALDSEYPLECSTAAQILWETFPLDVYEKLRIKLKENKTPLFHETVLSLLSEREAMSNLNIVEKIHYLSQSSFFESFMINELMLIAQGSVEVHFDMDEVIYKQGEPADALYYIIAGEVLIRKDDQEIKRYFGDYFGEGSFFGETKRNETVYSNESKVLVIYRTDIDNYAKTYPKIAIELLKNKLMEK